MPHDSIIAPTADTPERRAFYDKIDKKNLHRKIRALGLDPSAHKR